MATIVINNTEHSIYAGEKFLIPGTNVLESFDSKKSDAEAFIKSGEITVKDSGKMTDEEKDKAVNEITNRETLEKVAKTFPKLDTSKAKKKLDNFDEQLKKHT